MQVKWFSLTYKTGQNGRCPQAESKPSNVTCNGGSNTCQDGVCIGSICALYGTNECECHQYRDEMCHVCCNNSYVSNKAVMCGIILRSSRVDQGEVVEDFYLFHRLSFATYVTISAAWKTLPTFFKYVMCNPCYFSPSLIILIPFWFILPSLVFVYRSKLLF